MNVQELTVPIRDGEMQYITFGTGPKHFVMIAGMSMGGLTGLGSAVAEAYAMFAEEYTVTVFDRCTVLPEGTTVRDMAEQTAEAMAALGIRNADLMGASQGGMIALCLALDHPELVRTLVLSSSSARTNPTSEETFTLWRELGLAQDVPAVNRAFFARVCADAFLAENAALLASLENSGTPAQCLRFAVLAEACRTFDRFAELPKVTCPALVIGVRGDKVLSGEASEDLAAGLGCPVYLYEGYGHAVCDEAPDYKQRLWDFFHSVPA